ncbi:thiol-disulfide oxidoreductase DCC family protein, partial [Nocardiopsis gilva]
MTGAAPMLIYDGNCGFCTRSVRLTERLPVHVTLTPWQETDLAGLGVGEERAEREVLWVASSGRVAGGADAFAELLTHSRGAWPLAGRMMK